MQGCLTSVTENSRAYCDRVEVLAKLGKKFEVFPISAIGKCYKVAKRKHLNKRNSIPCRAISGCRGTIHDAAMTRE